jgi:hypothetical protein
VSGFLRLALLLVTLLPAWGATLERLSLDEMIRQSTAIVRGSVLSEASRERGNFIFRQVQVRVTETLKGAPATVAEFSLPGGTLNGVRQVFSGTPQLQPGAEYVFFLWKSSRGATHIIGLAQGVLNLTSDAKGSPQVVRAAIADGVIDPQTGAASAAEAIAMPLASLRQRIRQLTAATE